MFKDAQAKVDTGAKNASADDPKSGDPNAPPPPKEDKLEYDPEDDVWALDAGKPSEGRKYAKSCINAFRPLMLIMSILGLFPLEIRREKKHGTYSCKFTWLSYASILFAIASIVVITGTFWTLLSVISISINLPEHHAYNGKLGKTYRSEEAYLYKRNTIALVVTIASFIHSTICMIAVYHRRHYIAKQLVYWTE
ncbi:unnamed protein product [Orchesella dallaii]|uniref:Uncharacterized protein n=1 Tax=Orchesella dallaii TaxID=48710 RepID=A0ABP1QX78_9HEXA